MVQEGFIPSTDRPTGGDSPVTRFKGVLANYKPEEIVSQRDQSKYMIINFNFTDVEVLASTEPYPFPIVIIKIGYKPPKDSRGGTKWDAFASSLRKLTTEGIEALVGKHQEWSTLPALIRSPLVNDDGTPQMDGNNRAIWGDLSVDCWKVVSVDGLGSVAEKDEDFNLFLVDLADGKTEPQFYEVALTNSRVTERPNIVEAIASRVLLTTLTEMKLLERDAEGILHKVKVSTETPTA